MIVSVKDGFKLVGISIVCFCAAFVCTFFLNYYLDVLPLKESVPEALTPLYEAQLATARLTCAVTGGFLSAIAVVMLVFYLKLYIDGHSRAIGTFKAMGYSDSRLAKGFLLFGASVFVGCGLGFGLGWAFMPFIYGGLTLDGLPEITPVFHVGLLFGIVIAPTLVFTAISYLYAIFALKKPALALLKGEAAQKVPKRPRKNKERPFLWELCLATLKSRKLLAFFVAFSCFCFSAMVQMGLSMENLVDGTMGTFILAIGVVLAVTSMFMAMTSLIRHNAKNLAVMKSMGFSVKERFLAIFAGYIPLALLGFAVGTVYQFGFLCLMINVVFKNVGEVPDYSFNVPVFFLTLALFLLSYALVFLYYQWRANKVSVKEIMLDE